jgi:uncharacterized paraquat-inducible protein A
MKMKTTECPNCDELITVKFPIKIGTNVKCKSCHENLIVVSTDPLELDWPFEDDEEEYSWDEDYETEIEPW